MTRVIVLRQRQGSWRAGVCVLELPTPSCVVVLVPKDMSQSICSNYFILILMVASKADFDIANRLHKARTQVSMMLYNPSKDVLQNNIVGT